MTLKDHLGPKKNWTDEKAMSSEESPFSNVKSLSKYIADLLENVSE